MAGTRPAMTRVFACTRSLPQRPHIGEAAGDGGGGGHGRADEMGAAAAALAALEIGVGGRGAALARLELVGVHGEAHRAAGLAPFEARLEEDAVEPLLLGLVLHGAR